MKTLLMNKKDAWIFHVIIKITIHKRKYMIRTLNIAQPI